MKREWSSYQRAIFDAYENTRKNIVIEATAGSGKTSCLLELNRRTSPGKRVLFMAFNKSIADELRGKIPEQIEVATFHSKGLKTLLQNIRLRFKVNENKCFQIGKTILDLEDVKGGPRRQAKYLFDLQTIWTFLRQMLSVDYTIDIPSICWEKDIEFQERMVEDIFAIEKEWKNQLRSISEKKEFQMDFTDMLWIPYIMIPEESFPKYSVVFVDEVQDTGTLQREMVLNYIKKGGRFISVGDSRQNIYSFMGANVEIFESYKRMENTITLPLSISYRCDKAIVEEAKKTFPNEIEPSPFAGEGLVRKGELKEAREGDFVLCRNNIPLVKAFIKFLEWQQKATIKGKDFGENLLLILDKINRIEDLDILLDEKKESLVKKGIPLAIAVNHPSYVILEEKCAILKLLFERWPSVFELRNRIEDIFVDKVEGVILSTIHKSKGLEADRVFFLDQELIPSPKAVTEKALYSEKCLRFVAVTRARHELIYCSTR